jgi:uncharacterized protein (TIGR03000 family)
MFSNLVRTGGALALAGAVLFLTSGTSEAAGHGGGGHGGGGHGGGGFHGGGFHGGGAHFGGYQGGGFHSGYHGGSYVHPSYGYRNSGYRGYGYYPYYSSGYYPLYGGYSGDYGTYYDPSLYLGSSPAYSPTSDPFDEEWRSNFAVPASPTFNGPVTPNVTTSQAAPVPAAPSASAALLTVRVPVDAEVLIDGQRTTSTGAVRQYRSPPLEPGSAYTYEVQARWQVNGKAVTQTHRVEVSAGAHATTTFPTPSAKGAP